MGWAAAAATIASVAAPPANSGVRWFSLIDSLGGSFVTAETGKMYGYLVSAGWSPD